MTLQDIFDQLSYGELSNVFAGEPDAEGNGITEAQRKKIFFHIRLGLTELHKRFLLAERTLTIQVTEGQQTYVVDPRYAASNIRSREANKYIQDTPENPFDSPIFKIERVYDADGTEMALNAVDDPDSVRTGSYNTLLLPDDYTGTTVKVVCRTDHDNLKDYMAEAAPVQVQINLPGSYLWALLLFVAGRFQSPRGAGDGFHEGNNYLAQFEAECQRLQDTNTVIQQSHDNTRFRQNGWA